MVFTEFVATLIYFILHVDKYVGTIIQNYGILAYFILFLIIFCETRLVITPFLPGDSLIFVIGAFATKGYINLLIIFIVLSLAAIFGDTINYWIGNFFGERVFAKSRFFKREYLERTKKFYEKYGDKTIILARFVPIIRTFAPFVAGIGKMTYSKFLIYNILGGILWVLIFLFSGFFFGEIPLVEENLTIVIFVIIFISILPPIIEYLRYKNKK